MNNQDDEKLLEITSQDGVTIVAFLGRSISAVSNLPQIADNINAMMTNGKVRQIIFDFHQVGFFSSETLGLLLDVWKRLQTAGGKMIISGINPQLHRVFRITNLDKIFAFAPDVKAAMESLKAQTSKSDKI